MESSDQWLFSRLFNFRVINGIGLDYEPELFGAFVCFHYQIKGSILRPNESSRIDSNLEFSLISRPKSEAIQGSPQCDRPRTPASAGTYRSNSHGSDRGVDDAKYSLALCACWYFPEIVDKSVREPLVTPRSLPIRNGARKIRPIERDETCDKRQHQDYPCHRSPTGAGHAGTMKFTRGRLSSRFNSRRRYPSPASQSRHG